jgi:phytoene dehydrogenase-like protein
MRIEPIAFRPASNLASDAHDVVVIGSGMGGLSAGLVLAKKGFKVCVLEQHYRPGGCLHQFFRNRIPFETGFHYVGGVGSDGTLARYLRYLGVYGRLSFQPLDPDGFDLLRFPEFSFFVPNGWSAFVKRLEDAFPSEKEAIHRYAVVCKELCRGSHTFSFQPPSGEMGKLTRMALGDFLGGLTANRRLKAVLCGQSMLYGTPPAETPLEVHALVIDSMLQGASGVKGGGDALAAAMVEEIRSHGGVVRLRSRVTHLRMEGTRLSAAKLESGEEVRGRVFISNAHPKTTLALLPSGVMRPAYVHRVESMREGISCLSGYFVTQDRSKLRRHNIYWLPSEDIDEVYRSHVFGEGGKAEKGVFLSFPRDRDPDSVGPRVVLALALMAYEEVEQFANSKTGKRGDDYQKFKEWHGQTLQDCVEWLLPDLAGKLERVEVSTPLTHRDYTGTPRGAIYGVRHSVDQWGKYALHPRTRIDNLLLTGQNVLLPGVLGVTVSAFITCGFLLGFDELFGEVARA